MYLSGEGSDQEEPIEEEAVVTADMPDADVGGEERLRKEMAKLRTGEEAIRFFAKHAGAMQYQSVYCNRVGPSVTDVLAPCDLEIVEQWHTQPEHFIVSANGIVRVCPGQPSERMSLYEWMHENSLFHVLSSMVFFSQFGRRKALAQWRSAVRYEDYNRRRQRLKRSCLLARPEFARQLVQAHALAQTVRDSKLNVLPGGKQACGLHELQQHQAVARQQLKQAGDRIGQRVEEAGALLDELAEGVRGAAEENPQQLLNKFFRCKMPSSSKKHSKGMVAQREEDKERARLQQLLEQDVSRLGDCARVVGYMMQSALVDAVLVAVDGARSRLAAKPRMFYVQPVFDEDGGVALDPCREQFEQVVDTLREDVLGFVGAVPTLHNSACFRQLVPHTRDHQSVAEALAECGRFDQCVGELQAMVCEGFDSSLAFATSTYAPLTRVYCFGRDSIEDWDRLSSQSEAVEQVSLIRSFQEDIDVLRSHYSVGLFLLDGRELRGALAQVPLRALRALAESPDALPEANATLELLQRKQEARAAMTVTTTQSSFKVTGSLRCKSR